MVSGIPYKSDLWGWSTGTVCGRCATATMQLQLGTPRMRQLIPKVHWAAASINHIRIKTNYRVGYKGDGARFQHVIVYMVTGSTHSSGKTVRYWGWGLVPAVKYWRLNEEGCLWGCCWSESLWVSQCVFNLWPELALVWSISADLSVTRQDSDAKKCTAWLILWLHIWRKGSKNFLVCCFAFKANS